jgi:hypothetical protein
MGDRAQIAIHDITAPADDYTEEVCVYLYTHNGGTYLPRVLARALARRQRWTDPEYLARIIFCEMVKGQEDGELNFGIGTAEHGDNEHDVIHVYPGRGGLDHEKTCIVRWGGHEFTFGDFVKWVNRTGHIDWIGVGTKGHGLSDEQVAKMIRGARA